MGVQKDSLFSPKGARLRVVGLVPTTSRLYFSFFWPAVVVWGGARMILDAREFKTVWPDLFLLRQCPNRDRRLSIIRRANRSHSSRLGVQARIAAASGGSGGGGGGLARANSGPDARRDSGGALSRRASWLDFDVSRMVDVIGSMYLSSHATVVVVLCNWTWSILRTGQPLDIGSAGEPRGPPRKAGHECANKQLSIAKL